MDVYIDVGGFFLFYIMKPFYDILDVPPELRKIPERPNIYDLLTIPNLGEETAWRIFFSTDKPSHHPQLPARNKRPDDAVLETPLFISKVKLKKKEKAHTSPHKLNKRTEVKPITRQMQ